jgi:hypothetical protein
MVSKLKAVSPIEKKTVLVSSICNHDTRGPSDKWSNTIVTGSLAEPLC